MVASYASLMSLQIPDSSQTYSARDAMLYALSLGLGRDPTDASQLGFVYEQKQQALPGLGVVLAHPGFWPRDLETGLDWKRIVHGGQDLILHRPLPVAADVVGRSRIVEIIDKGPGKGALVYYERRILDRASGELLCTNLQTMFCRGDGGIGGPIRAVAEPHRLPQRDADYTSDWPTLPQTALLYRLNGDVNPLHADPEVARTAGFDRPILQGLATFGIAAWAIVGTICEGDAAGLVRLTVRFTATVYPGETLRTEMWRDGNIISFRVRVLERDVIAIDNGFAELR
jgi:acyl dehydratase